MHMWKTMVKGFLNLSIKQRNVASKINCVTITKVCNLNNPRKYLISQKSKQTKNEGGKYFLVKRPTLQSQTSLDFCFKFVLI